MERVTPLEQWRELEAMLANATGPSCKINMFIENMVAPLSQELDDWSGSIDAALAFAENVGVKIRELNFHANGAHSVTVDICDTRIRMLQSVCSMCIAILRAVCAAKIKELENDAAV